MNAFRLKKQLWRRWRRWKKALWVGSGCAVLTLLAWAGMRVPAEISSLLTHSTLTLTESFNNMHTAKDKDPVVAVWKEQVDVNDDQTDTFQQKQLLQTITQTGVNRTVHLKINYISGEETETLSGVKGPVELEKLIAQHPGWRGWISNNGDLWLGKRVDDLSPTCKKDSYISVDEHGNLTLFKGPPAKEEVMKTFFQMDMGSMKSSVPENIYKQLQDGIRVQDIEEYNSVLSTFSDYARDSSEQVMQNKN